MSRISLYLMSLVLTGFASSHAFAQVADDEIQQRLAELNKRSSTRPAPETRPAANVIEPAPKPVAGPKRLVLLTDAPADVAEFFKKIPELRVAEIKRLEALRDMAENKHMGKREQVKSLENAADAAKRNRNLITAPPLGCCTVAPGDYFRVTKPAKVDQVMGEKDFILMYLDLPKREQLMRQKWNEGSAQMFIDWGTFATAVQDSSLQTDDTLQLNERVWIVGVDTSKLRNDDDYSPADTIFVVTGRKFYDSVGAGRQNAYVAEPVHYETFIVAQ